MGIKMTNRSRIIILFLFISLSIFGQSTDIVPNHNSFLSRFGYKISLYSLNKFDSNILRLSSGTADLATAIYPSLTLSYPFSSKTKITAQYMFGLEKYISTSFLNTNYSRVGLKLDHYFMPILNAQVYGFYIHSNQPDILTTSSSIYRFATFDQYSGAVKLNLLNSNNNLYSLEYSLIRRNYSHLLTLTLAKQQDITNYIALGFTHKFSIYDLAYLKLGFINNSSNNFNYDYKRQFINIFFSHKFYPEFELQFEDLLSTLNFSGRKIFLDPNTTRRDIINTFMIGLKKKFTDNIYLNVNYYLQKDFSNDQNRKFLSNSFQLGLLISFGKNASYEDQNYYDQQGVANSLELNKEIITAERYTNTGYQYLLKADYKKALEYSLKAIALKNNIEQAHINAGVAYYKLGMQKNAVAEWEIALKLNPKNIKLSTLIEKAKSELSY